MPAEPPPPTARGPFIGKPLPRLEDRRLLLGRGLFTDDRAFVGQVFAVFVRARHAHARIVTIDTAAARQKPGVLAVLTAEDYRADGLAPIAQMPVPNDALDVKLPAFTGAPGTSVLTTPQWPLAVERVRYPGEPVAVAIAETLAAARDAAEAVAVDYAVLPAVTDALAALEPDAPQLWPEAPGNLALTEAFGDADRVNAALADSDLVIEHTFRNQRIATAQMEPRAAIGEYDAAADLVTLTAGCQGVHRIRMALARCLTLPNEKVRVVCPDTGGGFGSRNNPHPEMILVAWAARRLGRPVKWTSDRSEGFLTDYQGRDLITKARAGFGRDGRIRALKLELIGNVGAETVSYVWLSNAYRIAPTVYDVPAALVAVKGVVTNTVPTAPFRGAGRPEATLVIERLLDMAAQKLSLDRIAIRRRNLIRHQQLPYRSATGLTYDSGDFRCQHGSRDGAGRLARRCRTPPRRASARQALRRRAVQLRRVAGRRTARARRGQGRRGRLRRACRRHPVDRPGARDQLRAGDGRPARRDAAGHPLCLRRHRQDRLRRRHPFRPLDAACWNADGRGFGQSDRARQAHRRGAVRGARGHCALRRRFVLNADQQSALVGDRHRPRRRRRLGTACGLAPAACRRPPPSPAASPPIRPAPRCAKSRSIPTPAPSRLLAMLPSTMPGRRSIQ